MSRESHWPGSPGSRISPATSSESIRACYVPRRQSEELARPAAELLATEGGPAADLCTGSGAIAAHLLAAMPATHVVGVEIDRSAAECARRNGVPVVVGDLAEPLASSAFGVVTAVAPMCRQTSSGLSPATCSATSRDVRSTVVRRAPRRPPRGDQVRSGLAARRLALVELGGEQDELLAPTLAGAGFEAVRTSRDQDGDLGVSLLAFEVADSVARSEPRRPQVRASGLQYSTAGSPLSRRPSEQLHDEFGLRLDIEVDVAVGRLAFARFTVA